MDPDGSLALAEIDRCLADRPHAEGQCFAQTARSLSRLRDTMIARHRACPPTPADRTRLAHLNAVISVVLAGHFPLGAVPWTEIARARDWLAAILADEDAAAAG